MPSNTDKRIDDYIARAQDFAKPILTHMRKLIRTACPDVSETMKWSFPHFEYGGAILCSMASFKQHCAFNFWKASLMSDPHKIFANIADVGIGDLGKIKSLSDLPSDEVFIQYIQEAARLNREGVKPQPKAKPAKDREMEIPNYFMEALRKNKAALKTFESFSFTNKRDYVEWVTEAKAETTRNKRLETAVEWMAEGKVRNWKYVKK